MKEYIGVVVNVQDKLGAGRRQIRIPDIHGGDYVVNSTNFTGTYIANEDLPWAGVKELPGLNPNVSGHSHSYDAGQLVKIVFLDQERDDVPGQQPLIVDNAVKTSPFLYSSVVPGNTVPVNAVNVNAKYVKSVDNFSYSSVPASGYSFLLPYANPCGDNTVPPGLKLPDKCVAVADGNCGQQSKINGAFAENIGDFLKIIQNTNGAIGTSLIDKYTGKLFKVTNYVNKYTTKILGIFRDSISWIKAIITKYAGKAIDQLTKLLMVPLSGVLKPIKTVLDQVLKQIGCTLGDIETALKNLIEQFLLYLVDNAINAAFSCLNTVVDGILNQIVSQVAELANLVFSSISQIAGLIGSFGDLAGQAIAAVLSFLGINCGGGGSCVANGTSSFTVKLFSNDGYGIPAGLQTALDGGLSALNSLDSQILTGQFGVNALQDATNQLNSSVQLGTVQGYTGSNNSALNSLLTTAESLIPTNLTDFCNSLGNNTNAVIIGSTSTANDSTYSIYAGNPISSGGAQTFTIRRDNSVAPGVINVVGYKSSSDNIRISSAGSVGDVNVSGSYSGADFVEDSSLPLTNQIFFYQRVTFQANESSKTISIQTNAKDPINNQTGTITYRVGVYRSALDVTQDTTYIGDNLKNPSSALNTAIGSINFTLPQPPIQVTSGNPRPPRITIVASGPTYNDIVQCPPGVIITSQPESTFTALDNTAGTIGVVAKSVTAGYTLNYQWQRSYSPSSGWVNLTNGSRSSTVSSVTSNFGVIAAGTTTTGSGYVISGFTESFTTRTISNVYSGATSPILLINPVSYYVNDKEYYRVIISSSGLTTATSNSCLVRVVLSGAFSYPIAVGSGNVIDNPNNIVAGPTPTNPSGYYCVPYVGSSITPRPSTSSGITTSGVTIINPPSPSNTTGSSLVGITAPSKNRPISVPAVVNDKGQVISIPVPSGTSPIYNSDPIISLSGRGVGATAKVILNENRQIKSIVVKSGGFGYIPNNTANLCGVLQNIALDSPGFYYTSTPTVYVDGDSSIATATIDPITSIVTGITITNPQNKTYKKPPRIDIIGGNGTGAMATAALTFIDCATVSAFYAGIINEYATPVTNKQPVSVVDCP
jgi:hypothetical protein